MPTPSVKSRGRIKDDDASSTKSMQHSPAVAPEEEEEVPLARVRDTVIAEKACASCFYPVLCLLLHLFI